MSKLSDVLEHLRGTLSYRDIDMKSLDMSRKAAAGNLTDEDYAQWAAITKDPYVSIDLVKTFIRTFKSKLSKNPFRPKDDETWAMGEVIKLNELIEEGLESTMQDGFTYYGVGVENGFPVVKKLDARYVLFDGSEATLKDCKNFVAFRIEPLSFDEMDANISKNYPSEYVTYDSTCEKVITSHYHTKKITEETIDELTGLPVKNTKTVWVLDVYNDYDAKPITTIIPNIDRCPVVRFVGEKVELHDKRDHYRGLYWTMGSLQKAFQLAATKMQIRVASEDDSNWLADNESISDLHDSWAGQGVRTYHGSDLNGNQVQPPIPVRHDNQFLIQTFNAWQACIQMMLSPLAESGSEAVTEKEVEARNEVRDAIASSFLRPAENTIGEIYRLIRSLTMNDSRPVQIVSGFLENEKRIKEKGELQFIYGLAKESGLNAQGIVQLMTDKSDLDLETKNFIKQSFMQDPYASPVVVQLKTQIQQLQGTIQQQNQKMAILQLQASQRMERQAEYTAMQERVKRAEIEFKRWKEEQEQTQQGRMEILKSALQMGNIEMALRLLEGMAQQAPSPLVTDNPSIDAYTEETRSLMASDPQQLATIQPQQNNPTMQGAIDQQQYLLNRQQLQQNLARKAQMNQMGG